MEWKTIQIDWVLMWKYWKRGFREDERGLKQVSHEKPFKKLFLGVSRRGKLRDESWKQFSWNFHRFFCDLSAHLRLISRLANRETPKNNFLKSFSWETYFKPLPFSLKPLFQYFYIKSQPIWMVFHSINISKIILNSFHWFGSLDYILVSFCALGWDFYHRGWENLIFVKFLHGIGFFCWFALDVGPLWQKEHVLRVDFMMFMHCFTMLFIVCMLSVW